MSSLVDVVVGAVARVIGVPVRLASLLHQAGRAAWRALVAPLERVRLLIVGPTPEAERAASWSRTLQLGGAAAAVMLLCGAAFWWRSGSLGVEESGVPDSQLWYSASTLGAFLACIQGSGRLLYGLTELSLDVLFLLAYATLLTLLIERIWRGHEKDLGQLWVAPLLGAGFDLLENVVLAGLAFSGTTTPPRGLVAIAASFTLLKYALAALSILLLGRILVVESPRRVHLLGLVWWALAIWLVVRWPAVALAVALLLAVVAQRKLFLLQYLFFLRFILIVALGLLLLPSLAQQISGGRLLGNLFVVDSWGGAPDWVLVFFPGFFLGMLTMSLMWATRLVLTNVPPRYKLPLVKSARRRLPLPGPDEPIEDPHEWGEPPERQAAPPRGPANPNLELFAEGSPGARVERLAPWLFALLGAPFAYAIWQRSGWSLRTDPRHSLLPLLVLNGTFLFWIGIAWWLDREPPKLWMRFLDGVAKQRWLQAKVFKDLGDRWAAPFYGFGAEDLPRFAFVLLVAAFYLAGWLFLNPGSGRLWDRIPAVSFVLLIAVVVVWGLTVLALVLDLWRVPVLITLLAAVFVAHKAANYDHYFDVVARPSPGMRLPTPQQALPEWRARNTSDFVTVVAASGGGIKASLWTARVLEELVNKQLGSTILLLSTNSGGSVGGMYFTDSFAGGVPPDGRKMERVVRLAGASSLSACAWAMAYPDLWHLLLGGYLPFQPPTHDRGWAMDRRWEWRRARLSRDSAEEPRRLGDWAADVAKGLRPAHVFNATAVESGAAFRLSSVALGPSWPANAPGSRPHEFWDFYDEAGADIEVATAARLSATFPWVSPMTRAWADPALEGKLKPKLVNSVKAFRLADGGYFDNFGIYSAIQFLEALGPEGLQERGVKRVLFVQIRATPEASSAETRGGIQYSFFGPVLAMNSVLNSSQVARNDLDVALLKELWARHPKPVEVIPVVLDLEGPGPLSWHLTRGEGDAVLKGWDKLRASRLETALRQAHGEIVPDGPPAAAAPVPPTACERYSAACGVTPAAETARP